MLNIKLRILVILCLLVPSFLNAQKSETITCELAINKNYQQKFGVSAIEFHKISDKTYTTETAPGNILIGIKRNFSNEISLKIDTNNDGNLEDESERKILLESSIVTNIKRTMKNNKIVELPYTIKYYLSQDKQNNQTIILTWCPHYYAEGEISYKNNKSLIALHDTNGDGIFDEFDFQATNIVIDLNHDGKFYGSEEWFWGEKIIPYSGKNFIVDKISPDGTFIIFRETDIKIPQVGAKVPEFVLKTVEGKLISSQDLVGKIYIIDFWASWCKPCVEKFSIIQKLSVKLKGNVQFYLINIDKANRIKYAKEIIKEYNLEFPHVMNGLGNLDQLWRMFGSMKEVNFGIPLYVLIDSESKIVYAGNGGDKNLSVLSQKLNEMVVN